MSARRLTAACWLALMPGLCAAPATAADPARFAFALIGDVPSNVLEARMLELVFTDFDEDLAFAVHAGDLKAGWERCDDSLFDARHALLDRSPVPLVYVPGDNEWTDCSRTRAGGFDPQERLEALRSRFFAQPRPLGPREAAGRLDTLTRQADGQRAGLPENQRWRYRGIRFLTLNLPGSNNALSAAGIDAGAWRHRQRMNEDWLRSGYALAAREGAAAVVVIGHANPRFERDSGRRDGGQRDAYAAFRALLNELADGFTGPTLFLHGDTHRHRVERISPKLLRVESYGSPFANSWVRIDVDPAAAEPFRITGRRASPPAQPLP